MKLPIFLSACAVYFLVILSWNGSAAYVSVDDCDEPGAHRYHAHSQQSSSAYTQTHPSPNGHSATSSSYMRTGSSGAYTKNDGDLQVAESVYSPSVAKVGSYQSTGGYGYRSHNEESISSRYGSIAPVSPGFGAGYVSSNTGYGASNTGYGASNTGYGASSTGYGAGNGAYGVNAGYGANAAYSASSDSNVREKFERLKTEADAFVHKGAAPPAGGVAIPIGSQVRQGSSGSQYQSSSQYGSTGRVLGVTYGTTGIEEEDNTQKLVPVQVPVPASGALVGSHKETHDSSISYSTSGVASPSGGVDLSVSHNTPLANHASAHNFEALKQQAESFVHQGGPPPNPSGYVSSGAAQNSQSSLSQQSTRVETLPVKHTDRGTLIVPVRVTVTREHTVLPDGTQQYVDQAGNVVTGGAASNVQSSSYSSTSSKSSSIGNTGSYGTSYQTDNTGGYVQPGFGSSSSYSYNSGAKVPPKVYTVSPSGTIQFPESNVVESSTTSYGSTYSKQTNVRQEQVVVPGAVQLVNTEEAEKRSNKLFDLVSGYGTFLPAKEEQVGTDGKVTGGYSSQSQTSQSHSQSSQSGVNGGYQGGVVGGYNAGNQAGVSGYQSGYEAGQEYNTKVTGSGGGYTTRTNGYQYVPAGQTSVYVPAGSVRQSTSYSSSYSNQGVAGGVPIGDPVSPPEVSGSYFTGAGGQRYSSHQAAQSSYGTSGGYGVGTRGSTGAYGVKTSGYDSGYGSGYGYAKDTQGYNSGYSKVEGVPFLCESTLCEASNVIPGSTGNVKKYGISSSWSSKSQTVNGKTTESKQAEVTVNDNGKVDTHATHTRR